VDATQKPKRTLKTNSVIQLKVQCALKIQECIRFFLILVNSLGIIFMKQLLTIPATAVFMMASFWTFTSNSAHAQDPEFTQYFANPLYLNPAFAGSARCPRLTMSYRNQWPAMSGSFVTTAAAYDQHVETLSGGLGFIVMNDQAGRGTLSTTTASGIYSYQQAITRKLSIKAAMQVTYMQKALDWGRLTFGDMIDPRRGFIYETQDIPRGGMVQTVDFSSGILGFTDKYYFGMAVHHLNEPNESLVVGTSRLPMKYTVHAGAVLPLQRSVTGIESTISPNVFYRRQGEFQQLNLGLYVNKGPLVGGIWYRGIMFTDYRDAFIVTLGIKSDVVQFGYSYDLTVSELTPATGGAHEISMTIQFDCRGKRSKFRTINCPSF
jgi:type IX secretion system PorP/SprF family membrane protein